MTIELPDAIACYFRTDAAGDADRVAQCFTIDAVVKDEGKAHAGREAIQSWKTATSKAYRYTSEPFAICTEGDRIAVTSRLEGDFPGSPIDLRYAFLLNGEKIARLEITLWKPCSEEGLRRCTILSILPARRLWSLRARAERARRPCVCSATLGRRC